MRWAPILAAIGAMVCLAAALPGNAHARPDVASLRVSQPVETQTPPDFNRRPPEQISFHELRLGDLNLPARAGRDPVTGERLVDATGLGLVLGSRFERHGNKVQFDRSQSGERAILDLGKSQLWVDGTRVELPDAHGIVRGDRLWLNLQALEGLIGRPTTISGLAKVEAQESLSRSAASAQERTGLVLASWSSEGAEPRWESLAPVQDRRLEAHSAQLRTLSGVFGKRIAKNARETDGRQDWRTAESWQIQGETALEKQDSNTVDRVLQAEERNAGKPRVAPEATVQSVRAEPTSNPAPSVFPARSPATGGSPKADKTRQHGLLWQAAYAPTAPEAAGPLKAPSYGNSNHQKVSVVQKYDLRGSSVLYERVLAVNPPPKASLQEAGPLVSAPPRAPYGAQVSGHIFLDFDGDGMAGAGDQRLEGQVFNIVDLSTAETLTRRTGSFGQFGLNHLAPGRYELRVTVGWQVHRMGVVVPSGPSPLDVDFAVPLDANGSGQSIETNTPSAPDNVVRRIRL